MVFQSRRRGPEVLFQLRLPENNHVKKQKIIIILIIVSAVAVLYFSCYLDDLFDRITIIDENSRRTSVTPTLDIRIDPDKNIIFCATMQLAWNKLCSDVIKETVEIENQPDYVNKLNELINETKWISDDSYVAMSGFVKDHIVEKINEEIGRKNLKFDNLMQSEQPDEIISFSCLSKELAFENPFESFTSNFKFGYEEIKVKAFGVFDNNENYYQLKLAKQVRVYYYNFDTMNEFIIELKTKSSNDQLIISTIKPEETLLKTYKKIDEIIHRTQKPEKNDSDKINKYLAENNDFKHLKIPKINFDITKYYKDIENKKVRNKNFQNYHIAYCMQNTKFKLNERGTSVKSVSKLSMLFGARSITSLIVNGPFIVYLKRRDAKYPYFMTYFGNDELLQKL